MKKWMLFTLVATACHVGAQPLKVAVLEFEDASGMHSEARLGGAIDPEVLAGKGLYALGRELVNQGGFVLIDRRDFINAIEESRPMDDGRPADAHPSFIHAAQALNADAVLRGQLLSFSAGKQLVNQGGHQADFSVLTLRVGLEALDAVDGTVIAMAEGSGEFRVRQTENLQTVLGESQVLDLLGDAVEDAAGELRDSLDAYKVRNRERPRVKLSVDSTEDPALVEIDGTLVGTTPLENFEVYQGDHVLTVGRSGYRDVTKRVLLKQDTHITVPLLRVELTADEIKEILDKVRFNAYIGAEPALVIETIERAAQPE